MRAVCAVLLAGWALTGATLSLPGDHGAHPDQRTEWWYVTGWLETAAGEELGFQVTFFRTRVDQPEAHPSAFAARQLIIAHAALSDPALGRLRHGQRIARASHGLAGADQQQARAWIGDWILERKAGSWETRVEAEDFALALDLASVQPPLLHGEDGYSRKGQDPAAASRYYSLPRLAVTGSVTIEGRTQEVTGSAWLDHEWSNALMEPEAIGWDWVGLQLDDGGSLMAFRMRGKDGGVRWAAATRRDAAGRVVHHGPETVVFRPGRRWRSPRTGVEYPVEFELQVGDERLDLRPLMDDQESDSRQTTGAIYWEGAVRAQDVAGRRGRGYLELTGYGTPLVLPGGGADSARQTPSSLP
ncbi:MAG: lipocalin-like domain-containing protein [Steroidobacteraceae bacterium]